MKKSTKRLFAALLAATSLLALTACGGGKTEAPKTDDSKTEQPAEILRQQGTLRLHRIPRKRSHLLFQQV